MYNKTQHFTLVALFVGLIILLGMTPLGLIPLGFIYVTILCVPVIIGTLLMGLHTGILLGAAFGAVSTIKMFIAPSALAGNLLGANVFLAVTMCILPRLLIPVAAHLTYHSLLKSKAGKLSSAAAAAIGSLTNTVFYLGLMLFFYSLAGLDGTAVQTLILSTGLIAGTSEAVVAALLVPPIFFALQKLVKKA
ncbi:MAG: ECF transporter S component [Clostridiales bacterium]|nr:ECF transporter S component [Clostridiales bacterium]